MHVHINIYYYPKETKILDSLETVMGVGQIKSNSMEIIQYSDSDIPAISQVIPRKLSSQNIELILSSMTVSFDRIFRK